VNWGFDKEISLCSRLGRKSEGEHLILLEGQRIADFIEPVGYINSLEKERGKSVTPEL